MDWPEPVALRARSDVTDEVVGRVRDPEARGRGVRGVRADADRGDAKAQFAILFIPTAQGGGDGTEVMAWIYISAERGYGDAMLAPSMMTIMNFMPNETTASPADLFHEKNISALRDAITLTGSADGQHAMGLVESALQKPTADKDDILETAKWFRAAAHQGLKEAQWELGVFCDVHMPFARKYIRKAARQGHPDAIDRPTELCRCAYCGADVPWKCSTFLDTRYCDAECSKKHWRRGGGVSEVCEAALPHRKTCPRTYDDPCDT